MGLLLIVVVLDFLGFDFTFLDFNTDDCCPITFVGLEFVNANGKVSDKGLCVNLKRDSDNDGAVAEKNVFPLGIWKGSDHGILFDNDEVV